MNDKLKHFLLSALIAGGFLVIAKLLHRGVWAVPVSIFGTLLLGIGKEVYDKYVKHTEFSISDFLADFFGVVLGGLIGGLICFALA